MYGPGSAGYSTGSGSKTPSVLLLLTLGALDLVLTSGVHSHLLITMARGRWPHFPGSLAATVPEVMLLVPMRCTHERYGKWKSDERLSYNGGYGGGSQTISKRCEYLQKSYSKHYSLVAWAAKVMAEGTATTAPARPLPLGTMTWTSNQLSCGGSLTSTPPTLLIIL